MITITNNGPAIESTNYFDTPHAKRGLFYLSWNARAARLLVPDIHVDAIQEMATAKTIIISRGPWTDQGGREAIEILFEDSSDDPFVLHLVAEQTDRLIPAHDQGGLTFTAWTRSGNMLERPCFYRIVTEIPCLEAWAGL